MPPRALRTPRPTASSRLPNACSRRRFRSRSLANASGLCFPSTGTACPSSWSAFSTGLRSAAVITSMRSSPAAALPAVRSTRCGRGCRRAGRRCPPRFRCGCPTTTSCFFRRRRPKSARRCSRRPTGGWTPLAAAVTEKRCAFDVVSGAVKPLSGLLHRYYESHRGVGKFRADDRCTAAAAVRRSAPTDDFARLRPPGLAGGMHPLSGLPPPLSRRRDTVRPRYGKAGAVCQPQGDVLSGCTSHIVYI